MAGVESSEGVAVTDVGFGQAVRIDDSNARMYRFVPERVEGEHVLGSLHQGFNFQIFPDGVGAPTWWGDTRSRVLHNLVIAAGMTAKFELAGDGGEWSPLSVIVATVPVTEPMGQAADSVQSWQVHM